MLLVIHNDTIIGAVLLTSRTPLCRRLCLSLAMNMIRRRPAVECVQNGQTDAILYPKCSKIKQVCASKVKTIKARDPSMSLNMAGPLQSNQDDQGNTWLICTCVRQLLRRSSASSCIWAG